MNYNDLKIYLTKIINEEQQENRAIFLNGPWGCGKTFLINSIFQEENINKNNIIITISLFGIEDLDTIYSQLFVFLTSNNILQSNKSVQKKHSLLSKSGGKLLATIMDTLSNKFELSPKMTLSALNLLLENNNNKIWIIFDDLERAGDSLQIRELLGFIDFLKKYCNIITIGCLDECKDETGDLKKYKEKVFEYECSLSNINDELLLSICKKYIPKDSKIEQYIKKYIDAYLSQGKNNIRIFIKILITLIDLESVSKNKEFLNEDSFITVLVLFIILKYNDNKNLKELCKKDNEEKYQIAAANHLSNTNFQPIVSFIEDRIYYEEEIYNFLGISKCKEFGELIDKLENKICYSNEIIRKTSDDLLELIQNKIDELSFLEILKAYLAIINLEYENNELREKIIEILKQKIMSNVSSLSANECSNIVKTIQNDFTFYKLLTDEFIRSNLIEKFDDENINKAYFHEYMKNKNYQKAYDLLLKIPESVNEIDRYLPLLLQESCPVEFYKTLYYGVTYKPFENEKIKVSNYIKEKLQNMSIENIKFKERIDSIIQKCVSWDDYYQRK